MTHDETMQVEASRKEQIVYGLEQIGKCHEDELMEAKVYCGGLDCAEVYRSMYDIPLMSVVNLSARQLERLKTFLDGRLRSGQLSETEYRILGLVFGTEVRCFREVGFSKSEQEYIARSTPKILRAEFDTVFNDLREDFLQIDGEALQREKREKLYDFGRDYEIRLADILEGGPFEVEVGFYTLDYAELCLDLYGLVNEDDIERIRDADKTLVECVVESLARRQLLTVYDMSLLEMLYGKIWCKLVDYPREVAIYQPGVTYDKLLSKLRDIFDLVRCEVAERNQ